MVPGDPGRGAAAQGSAVLSSVRRERRDRVHRLCVGAEPAAGQLRGAGPSPTGRRGLRPRRQGQLPAAQHHAELKTEARRCGALSFRDDVAAYFGAAGAPCCCSSFLRSSSAFFCRSSCIFFCCSSYTFGSVAGPSFALAKSESASGKLTIWFCRLTAWMVSI